MATKRMTDIELLAQIIPNSVDWPADDITMAWVKIRECPAPLRNLVKTVDIACSEIEADPDLNPNGIRKKLEAIGLKALEELRVYKPLVAAEGWVKEHMRVMAERTVKLPDAPADAATISLNYEIREFVRAKESPFTFLMNNLTDQQMMGAALNAPAYLVGLTEAQKNLLREHAEAAIAPEQVKARNSFEVALKQIRQGVAAAKRIIAKRTGCTSVIHTEPVPAPEAA